jgi:hypothetical protein
MAVGYLANNTGQIAGEKLAGSTIMGMSGNNLGNLAFWHATKLLFNEPVEVFGWKVNVEEVRPRISHFVIPAANFLNPAWDLQELCDLVTNIDRECLVFGLGAQSSTETTVPNLRPGTIAFLRAISERSKTLFVRGEYTAEVCAHYGVTNVTAVGCPSFMISSNPELGRDVRKKIGSQISGLYSAGGTFGAATNDVERDIFRYIHDSQQGMYVIQDPAAVIDLISGHKIVDPSDRHLNEALTVLGGTMGTGWAAQALQQYGRYFLSISNWMSEAVTCDYAISTRIHGAILPLMAGIPSVVIGHDARVRELANMLRLPMVTPVDAQEALYDIPRFFEALNFDGYAFDQNRRKLASIYVETLAQCGLTPSQHLCSIARDSVLDSNYNDLVPAT